MSAGAARRAPTRPTTSTVTLDKTIYAPGETAKLSIASRFAGKATIALIGDKLERFVDVDLEEGDNVAPFEVGARLGRGRLCGRDHPAPARRQSRSACPAARIGLAWFSIDEAARKLDVAIHAPEKTRPRQTVKLPIKLARPRRRAKRRG